MDITLSVIIPCHNEQEVILDTILSIISETDQLAITYNIYVVDDGSTDDTWELILQAIEVNPNVVKGVKLARNFGKDKAILAGLESSCSELYLVIDADGEHPTNKIQKFYHCYQKNSCSIVDGIKRNRRGTLSSKFLSRAFNRIFKYFTKLDLTESSDFKLFNHKFKRALLNYNDYDFFFRAAAEDIGFQREKIFFDECERVNGSSSWDNSKLIKYAFNLIVNYSHFPLFLILFLGVLSVALGVVVGMKALFDSLFGTVPEGYLTLLVLPLISLGVIMTAVGVIGVYLSKILDEVKGRPKYIIDKHAQGTLDK